MGNKEHINKVCGSLCSSCAFFNEDSKALEDSCVGGLLNKMYEADNPVNFCLAHRPKESETFREMDKQGHKTLEDFAQACIEQSGQTFGIIVYDDSEDEQDIKKTAESINKINYLKDRFLVVLSVHESTLVNRGSSILDYINNYNELHSNGIKTRAVFHNSESPIDLRETEIFRKVKYTGRFVNMDAGSTIDPDFLDFINNKALDMEKVIYVEDTDNNVTCIPKSVASTFYLNYLDYKEMLKALIKESMETNTYLKYEKK